MFDRVSFDAAGRNFSFFEFEKARWANGAVVKSPQAGTFDRRDTGKEFTEDHSSGQQ
jgi:hypothetical protein